jgi:putative phosphoesterase
MRIGLITDTHIPDIEKELPPQVFDVFRGVDLILHAGDIYSLSVLDDLERIAPVKAAMGDDDSFTLLGDRRVEPKHVLDLGGHIVWLVHERFRLEWLPARQQASSPGIIVHGHTHEAEVQTVDGVVYIGSGSPTFLEYRRGLGTVAIMEIGPGGVEAGIVRLDGKSRSGS